MFNCPSCKMRLLSLEDPQEGLRCDNLNCELFQKEFNQINNIPVLIPFGMKDCIFLEKEFNSLKNNSNKHRERPIRHISFINNLKRFLYGKSVYTFKNFNYLATKLKKQSRVLIIGGGQIGSAMNIFYQKCTNQIALFESIDVYPSPNITAIADAHYLPYTNDCFDFVIIQAVLEHVINPNKVVSEIFRVLKNDGIVYAETPFLQSVHEGPYDFTRFTHSGHRWLFKDFLEVKSGYLFGGFSSTLFVFSHTLAGLFRNKIIGIILRIVFTRLALILDLLIPYKLNIDVGSGFYFLGKKSSNHIGNLNLIISSYYSGGQNT